MEIIYTVLRNVAYAVVDPYSALMIILMGIVFYISNKKIIVMQKSVLGEAKNTAIELTVSQIVMGILAGAVLSLMLTYLGVIFNSDSSVFILFILTIVSVFIPNKHISLAYTAAILGIISMVINPILGMLHMKNIMAFDINIISLLALVGSVYFVQGILTVIDGSRGSIPIFAKKENSIIGGFAMKRNWIFPLALLMLFRIEDPAMASNLIEMPKWWPILKGTYNASMMAGILLALVPIYAVVGVNTATFTRTSKSKARLLGGMNAVYGLIILALSVFARIGYAAQALSLILIPVLYEMLLKLDYNLEIKGKAKYVTTDEGLMILDVTPNSPANKMGINSGDVILEANGINLAMEENIFEEIKKLPLELKLKIKNAKGIVKDINYIRTREEKKLGIVFVPKVIPEQVVVNNEKINIKKLINKFKDDDKK